MMNVLALSLIVPLAAAAAVSTTTPPPKGLVGRIQRAPDALNYCAAVYPNAWGATTTASVVAKSKQIGTGTAAAVVVESTTDSVTLTLPAATTTSTVPPSTTRTLQENFYPTVTAGTQTVTTTTTPTVTIQASGTTTVTQYASTSCLGVTTTYTATTVLASLYGGFAYTSSPTQQPPTRLPPSGRGRFARRSGTSTVPVPTILSAYSPEQISQACNAVLATETTTSLVTASTRVASVPATITTHATVTSTLSPTETTTESLGTATTYMSKSFTQYYVSFTTTTITAATTTTITSYAYATTASTSAATATSRPFKDSCYQLNAGDPCSADGILYECTDTQHVTNKVQGLDNPLTLFQYSVGPPKGVWLPSFNMVFYPPKSSAGSAYCLAAVQQSSGNYYLFQRSCDIYDPTQTNFAYDGAYLSAFGYRFVSGQGGYTEDPIQLTSASTGQSLCMFNAFSGCNPLF